MHTLTTSTTYIDLDPSERFALAAITVCTLTVSWTPGDDALASAAISCVGAAGSTYNVPLSVLPDDVRDAIVREVSR